MSPWKPVEVVPDRRRQIHRKIPTVFISTDFVRLNVGAVREFFAGYEEGEMFVEIFTDSMKIGFKPNKENKGCRVGVLKNKQGHFACARICGRDTIRATGLIHHVGKRFVAKTSSTEPGLFFIVLNQGMEGF